MSRLHQLQSILNFRDFGDYPTRFGGHISKGKLFRSAHLAKASDADMSYVDGLGISTLVDLRHLSERERQPNKWTVAEKTGRELLYVDDRPVDQIAPHEMFYRYHLEDPQDAHDYMMASYADRPKNPHYIKIFAGTLKAMAEDGGGVLIHCAAGKDRTGTLAAIILSALGADDDTIMEDYMLTMKAVDVENILPIAARNFEARYGRALTVDQIRPIFGVKPDYLKASLSTIGDMDSYIRGELKIGEADLKKIRENYLAA